MRTISSLKTSFHHTCVFLMIGMLSAIASLTIEGCIRSPLAAGQLSVTEPEEGQVIEGQHFANINCGNGEKTCSSFLNRSTVILNVLPPSDHNDANWNYLWGGDCDGAIVCKLDMKQPKQALIKAAHCNEQAKPGQLEYCLLADSLSDTYSAYEVYNDDGHLISEGSSGEEGLEVYYWASGIDGKRADGSANYDTASTYLISGGWNLAAEIHEESGLTVFWNELSLDPGSSKNYFIPNRIEFPTTEGPLTIEVSTSTNDCEDAESICYQNNDSNLSEHITVAHTQKNGLGRLLTGPANTNISLSMELAGEKPNMYHAVNASDYVKRYTFTHHPTGVSLESRNGVLIFNDGQGKECYYNTLDWSNAKAGNVTHHTELGCAAL